MRIIHLITTIARGGAETQLLTLVREQIHLGNSVSIYYLKGIPELEDEFSSVGAHVHHDLVGLTFIGQVMKFQRISAIEGAQLHAHLPKSELIASLVRRNVSLVLSKHNAEPFYPGAPRIISRLLAKFVSLRSDGIIYISEAVKMFVHEHFESSTRTKGWVVHYGFNPAFNYKVKREIRSDKTKVALGTVARLAKQKDLKTLILGFLQVRSSCQGATLTIVGRGPEQIALENFVQENRLNDSVNWIPFTENVYRELSQMDIFCLTSKYEGFGLVLLEAMQSGIPIVASRNSAIVEVLGSEYPYLFETSNVGDLVEKINILNDDDNYQNCLKYLQERLEQFSPQTMASRIQSIYEELGSI